MKLSKRFLSGHVFNSGYTWTWKRHFTDVKGKARLVSLSIDPSEGHTFMEIDGKMDTQAEFFTMKTKFDIIRSCKDAFDVFRQLNPKLSLLASPYGSDGRQEDRIKFYKALGFQFCYPDSKWTKDMYID